jgi:hypothetical protein
MHGGGGVVRRHSTKQPNTSEKSRVVVSGLLARAAAVLRQDSPQPVALPYFPNLSKTPISSFAFPISPVTR